jgi:hypothetical protein
MNNKHSLRSNTKGYGGKSHWTDSQNSDTIAPSGRELYHLEFSLRAASPETSGYTIVYQLEEALQYVQPWMTATLKIRSNTQKLQSG